MLTFSQLGWYGRFANQLYQIAGVIGIATKCGQSFGFPEWINWDHKERFGSNEDCSVQKFFENELPRAVDVPYEPVFIHWGYHDVFFEGNYDITGHLQSPKYFSHCIDIVRHYLKMKDEYEPSDVCVIHYRAGDYIDDPNAYHPRCSFEYYKEAVKYIPEGIKFILVSDDIESFSKMMKPLIDFEVRKGDYIDDFKFMKSCKHHIISNSSFSAMAATLAEHPDKIVVSPRKWFGQIAGINGDDIHGENWKVI